MRDIAVLPTPREVSDEWDMTKDGLLWFERESPKSMPK